MIKETKTISRKDFIKGAAASLAGVAAFGLVGCSNDTQAAPTTTEPDGILWDYETDVVVVGFGGAGAAAAWEAGTAGAEVIILEKEEKAGGSTNICGGLITIGGGNALQKAAGFEDTVENFYNYLVASLGQGTDEKELRVFAEKSPEMYTWLTEKIGVVFKSGVNPLWPEPPNYEAGLTCTGDEYSNDYVGKAVPVYRTGWVESELKPGQKDGSGFFQPLLRAVNAIPNVKVMYQTPGEELVYDHDLQRVIGVKAKQNDKDIMIKARKAVILTAGGFGNNKEMVKTYCPAFIDIPALGTGADTGDGIRMAQAVGAAVRNMHFAFSTINATSYFTQAGCAGGPLSQGILVNQLGVRFVAEDHYHSWLAEYMLQNQIPDKYIPSYAVFDSKIMEDVPENLREGLKNLIQAEANSFEELAKALGTPEGVLENTIRFYNSCAAKGVDVLFNKRKQFITPIEKPPFYAAAIKPSVMFTTGGLRINTDARVLSAATGEPIKGLYSAGRNASNVIAQQYGGSGMSVASCFVFGRIAGQKAAAEPSWS